MICKFHVLLSPKNTGEGYNDTNYKKYLVTERKESTSKKYYHACNGEITEEVKNEETLQYIILHYLSKTFYTNEHYIPVYTGYIAENGKYPLLCQNKRETRALGEF